MHNPFDINDIDWGHMLSLAVIALKAFVHPQDIGFVDDLKEENFWEVLTPLLEGSVHSVKERVRELVTQMSGNMYGSVQPIQDRHQKLVVIHDLPRYMHHMKRALKDMGEQHGQGEQKWRRWVLMISCRRR